MTLRAFAACLVLMFSGSPAAAQWGNATPMVDASLIADHEAVEAGSTLYLALHQDITTGWHTYWRNPGDSGEPTRLELNLPDGWTAGEMVWPAPEAIPLGPLTNYGYSDAVTLPVPVQIPASAIPGLHSITAEATWLVCEEICIPEEASLALDIIVGPSRLDETGKAWIDAALDAAPETLVDVRAGQVLEEGVLYLTLTGGPFTEGESSLRALAAFPLEGGVIDHAAPQTVRFAPTGIELGLEAGFLLDRGLSQSYPAVVTFEQRQNNRWVSRAVTVAPEAGLRLVDALAALPGRAGGIPDAADEPVMGGIGLVQAIGLALLGGLLLNLMPCVFPILSMKALNLVGKRDASTAHARELGLIFGAGVVLTFMALGAAVVALRYLGLPDLWGFQLQVPVVVAGLALLMFLIGLNFLGVFEIGTSLQGVGGGVNGSTRSGSFLTGVLAVFVAAPCLAPFMAAALTFALSQSPAVSLVIFACLGVGLALPFVAVSFSPGLLRLMPRPGPWMVRFRQFLAFPMFATAIWLIFVLAVQTGAAGVVWVLASFLAAGFAIWALKAGGPTGIAAGLIGLALTVGSLSATARLDLQQLSGMGGEYENWTPDRVAELRAQGRAVFVDFTAAWCVSCQVNKLGALAAPEVQAEFARANVALLRADFTNRDPDIAAALARHGAAGVPLYLMYPEGGGEPAILPPLLTETTVIRAIRAAVD